MSENTTMMYDKVQAVSELNKVDGFEPRSLMRTIEDGKLYLDVQFRMLWFRLKYPEGKVTTKLLNMTDKFAVVEARVYLNKNDSDENYISSAMAQRWFQADNQAFGDKYVECAETAAIGRGLARAGFGLQFCDVDGEKDPSIVDSPISVPSAANTGNAPNNTKVTENTNNTTPAKPATNTPVNTTKTPPASPATNIPGNTAKTPPASPAANIPGKPPVNTSANVPPKTENSTPAQSGRQYDASTAVDEICGQMSLDDAKSYIVDVGFNRGKTLGQIAIEKPASLEWYVKTYTGPDNILRAGAKLLITEATKQAG